MSLNPTYRQREIELRRMIAAEQARLANMLASLYYLPSHLREQRARIAQLESLLPKEPA